MINSKIDLVKIQNTYTNHASLWPREVFSNVVIKLISTLVNSLYLRIPTSIFGKPNLPEPNRK